MSALSQAATDRAVELGVEARKESEAATRLQRAALILGMPLEHLENALMCAWSEGQLSDEDYVSIMSEGPS